MKIAMPVERNSIETNICPSFGRTPYFFVYETDTKESTFLDNSNIAGSPGGAGIKAAQAVVDHGVDALITPRCGENAAEVIHAAGIKIYKTLNDSVQDNINAFTEGRLSLLEKIHPGFHNHGGK